MKYQPKFYARAFLAALDAGTAVASATKQLLATLERHGDRQRAGQVAAEIEKRLVQQAGGHLIDLEFAREPQTKARAALLSQFGPADLVRTKVTPALVAGVRLQRDGREELDLSLAGRLEQLFTA